MEFKAGDRVRVLRLDDAKVDFYATLTDADLDIWELVNCSDYQYEGLAIYKETENGFGMSIEDYYVLAEDEEDTEAPEVQFSEEMWRQAGKNLRNFENAFNNKCDSEQRTTDPVNHPDHYNYGEIEIIDFIDQVSEHYNPVVAVHIANAIKYLSRAPHKNGKEDIEKARWYIERAYQKWSD
ncbi:DUF3310 domain-containing protein [Mammaliicoccus lentus]|uniref:DUF3310 domain-containing protein n=1 Tax=Mammaliicoccus lentus TaxID=42858 RepID=UPI002DB5DB20|nr:DUF3310 domain-containing protein [Mammaliicoccus lentus]MEB8093153.1 DUF3310 domain-containing protein [Mammaliicoccus lentus]